MRRRAGKGGAQSTDCICCGRERETMYHLSQCPVIHRHFFRPLLELMRDIGLNHPEHVPSFLTVGRIDEEDVADENQTGMLFLAWRCLYAALMQGHEERRRPNLSKAYKRCISMIISRLKAYGGKWKRWCNRNANTQKKKVIPLRYRDRVLIKQDRFGDYVINKLLIDQLKT